MVELIAMDKSGIKLGEIQGGGTMRKARKKPSPMLLFWLCFFSVIFIVVICPGLDPFGGEYISSRSRDICHGRHVYMYPLPVEFNVRVHEANICDHNLIPWMDLCPRFGNGGYGLQVVPDVSPASELSESDNDVFDASNWYDTDSYMLEMIYHNRMKSYHCLTDDPSKADAFYVPYYVGLLALTYLYEPANVSLTYEKRKFAGMELINWLQDNGGQSWKRHGGKDHFLVLGRTAWDFTMFKVWGTGFSNLPYVSNMTALLIEKDLLRANQQAIPYPTSFHPSSPEVLEDWIDMVKNSKRDYLFSYVGAPRPYRKLTVRGLVGTACINAGEPTCKLVNCTTVKCSHDPVAIYKAFLGSDFCLQPRGDTATRRSTFDCLIAGAIPVFFHNDSAYTQYLWHLPRDRESYSVFIPEDDIISNPLSIRNVLMSIPPQKILEMRRNIVSFIPNLVYNNYANDPWIGRKKDAFELSIERVISRVKASKRELQVASPK